MKNYINYFNYFQPGGIIDNNGNIVKKPQQQVQNTSNSHSFNFGQIFEPSSGMAESVSSTSQNTSNSSQQNDSDRDLPSFKEWLYTSGGMGIGRRIANVANVVLNYVHGMIHPSGNTIYNFGDGNQRQLYAGYLYNQNNPKTVNGKKKVYNGINDTAHYALGGLGTVTNENGETVAAKHSGDSFKHNQGGLRSMFGFAADSPYHNIYGQSAGAYIDENGDFVLSNDNYTFNNDWSNYDSATRKGIKEIGDGEGNAGFMDAIGAGLNVLATGRGGIQAAMETAASKRGVNTKRNSNVARISAAQIAQWKKEYEDFLKNSKKQQEYFEFKNR